MSTEIDIANRLAECEADIDRATVFIRGGYYVAGKRYKEIKEQELWKQADTFYGTFDRYCESRWLSTRSTVEKMIRASGVVDNLCTKPVQLDTNYPQDLPLSESVARVLVPLDKDAQKEIWKKSLDQADGKPPTAGIVRTVMRADKYAVQSPQVKAPEDKRIMVGSFADHSAKIPDNSLSLIFTDPPYNVDHDLQPLADMASEKLAPGGSLVFYLGHLQLPQIFAVMSGKLRFWWIGAVIHQNQKALMKEYGVRVGWKPLLWFVKETRRDPSEIVTDVMDFGNREKEAHEWQQSVAEAAYWIERLCPQDGLLYDPYLGGGTTIVAAKTLGRNNWIASEIDPETAAKAQERIRGISSES